MSMRKLRNWTIQGSESGSWHTLVKAPAVIRSLIIANTAEAAASVRARVSRGPDDERSIILPTLELEAGKAEVLDVCQLNLGRSDELQFQFSIAGVDVTASGEEG